MKSMFKLCLPVLATILLASCGGGGGGDGHSAFTPPSSGSITLTAGTTDLPLNPQGMLPWPGGAFTSEVTITVRRPDGSLATDVDTVGVHIGPVDVAAFSTLDDPETDDVNEIFVLLGQGPVDVVAGKATVFVTAGATKGTSTLTVTVPESEDRGLNFKDATLTFTVGDVPTPPPAEVPQVVLGAQTQDLPLNTVGAEPNPGGPFTSEVEVTIRKADGSLASEVTAIDVSINPVSVATFSYLDDPETDDIYEPSLRLGQATVDVVAGKSTLFVTSYKNAGSANLTVTVPLAASGEVSFAPAQMAFTVGNVAAPTPRNISVTSAHDGVYLPSSGGRSSTLLTASITDAGGQSVPDTTNANVQFEVLGGAAKGNLVGGNESGQKIQINSTNGIAQASFGAGTEAGVSTIRITADGADNDVSNGISEPVSAEIEIVVSDGQAYSVTIVSPIVNAISVNGVSGEISAPVDEDGNIIIPAELDGSYSLRVSALVTDRQGNPALPGTMVSFGAIDAPLTGYPTQGAGYFTLSGVEGDPKEGGTLFTATDGAFLTLPGGGPQDKAGPGDTLLVYGKAVAGNSDLESARTVASVDSDTSLSVSPNAPFNLNDTTGQSIDFGDVLPWAIGRADSAAIDAQAPVDEHGVASVRLTYPINQLGKHVAIFAATNAATASNPDRIANDIADIRFAGVAPARIAVYPTPIAGNGTMNVTVCVYDALEAPMAGMPVAFGFHDLGAGGQGWIDDHPGAGYLDDFTGSDGCAVGEVRTIGIAEDAGDAAVLFNAAGASADVPITAAGSMVLLATPSSLGGLGGTVTLTLLDPAGNPVPGVQIGVECEASGGTVSVTVPPGATDSNGETTSKITADLDGFGEAGDGTCTFNTAGGPPEAEVTLQGIDLCTLDYSPSPPPALCSTSGGGSGSLSLALLRTGTSPEMVKVTSSPTGFSCVISTAEPGKSCGPVNFPDGTVVILSAEEPVNAPGHVSAYTWGGDCSATAPGALTATVSISAASSPQTCSLEIAH